ncbi:MAG: hypothetical protein LAO31_14155 [Acidobacteriia bacterium]|nr:hypothetical protein [Terriglobia bacterium]
MRSGPLSHYLNLAPFGSGTHKPVDPEKQGKPLVEELAGYRSLRAVGQRYRIIYRVDRSLVIAVGIRKAGSQRDIYSLAKKLIRLRLVEPSKAK